MSLCISLWANRVIHALKVALWRPVLRIKGRAFGLIHALKVAPPTRKARAGKALRGPSCSFFTCIYINPVFASAFCGKPLKRLPTAASADDKKAERYKVKNEGAKWA